MRYSGGRRNAGGECRRAPDRCDEETGLAAATTNVAAACGESLHLKSCRQARRREAAWDRQNLAHAENEGKRRTVQKARRFAVLVAFLEMPGATVSDSLWP